MIPFTIHQTQNVYLSFVWYGSGYFLASPTCLSFQKVQRRWWMTWTETRRKKVWCHCIHRDHDVWFVFIPSFAVEGEGEIEDESAMESYELEFDIKKFLHRWFTHTLHTPNNGYLVYINNHTGWEASYTSVHTYVMAHCTYISLYHYYQGESQRTLLLAD